MSFLHSSGSPKSFKDVAKPVNDLLKKDFPLYEKYLWKTELAAPSDSGTFSGSLTKNPEGLNVGDFSYKLPTQNGDFLAKFDLERILKLEFHKKNFPLKGFDTTEEFTAKLNEKWFTGSLKLGENYRTERLNGSAAFNYCLGNKEESNFNSSLVVGTPEFALGLETDISDKLDIKSLNGLLAHSKSDHLITLFWKSKRQNNLVNNTIGTNFYFKSSLPSAKKLNLAVGGELEYKLSDSEVTQNPILSFGVSISPDNSSSIKSRLLSTGYLGISFQQQWNSSISLTGSVDIDTKNPTAPDAFKYGFKLALLK